jgi:predicted O-methyltransferase YrrM
MNPLSFIYAEGWAPRRPQDSVQLPVGLELGGGTQMDELVVLATVTRVLAPAKVFEIGTFLGQTTSVFVLNTPAAAAIVTMDLPSEITAAQLDCAGQYIDTDRVLVDQRNVGSFLRRAGLDGRYRQVFCDSMDFDAEPEAGTVELGFIDGAHSRDYVENDTRKMATMMAERGIVFWHDYGGKGRFRDLTEYLDQLARTIDIYRVANTSLAWAPARQLRTLTEGRRAARVPGAPA